jgi:hypothetical protein
MGKVKRSEFTFENKFWTYFGYGEGWEEGRCNNCYDLMRRELRPNAYCINCWKLEIFYSNTTDLEAVKEYFLEEARKDHTLHGKWSKFEITAPNGAFTSIPSAGHPDPDVKKNGVILIYNKSIKEREARRKKIIKDLKRRNLYKKDDISYRRGCLNFDELIGTWVDWYDLESDYPEAKLRPKD